MARLGPTGLNQLLTDIKNWVNSKLSTKSDTAHTHTAYAVKHTYTTAASAAKNWYRIANANTKQVYTGNPIHAEFILTAYNSSYDPGYSERWYVRAMVLGRNAHVVIFGGNTAPFSQCRVLYENTLADIDDNDRPAIDIYLNYVLANGTTKIEIEEVYNQGWTFVADGQLAVSTVPTGFENVAVSIRGNGVERSTYSDIATYLNKPRRDITSNVTLADNTTYRSTTLNCTGTRTITLPSINSNYFWCVIKNFNAEADIITIHPSTTAVLIDGSNDDIVLRPGEFVAIHSRAANSFTIVGDNRKRTCLVGRSGEVGTDTKHWFRVAQKTLTTRYRDAFILLDVFHAGCDSNYMGRLCAHVRVDNTIGVVGNKQFTWLYRGTQLSDDDFAMTTIETSGTSVVVDIWCKRTGGYSAFEFVVVSEGFSTDSPDSPAGKWILTRARATVGDLESLDTGFTTVTNPTVVTLANSITGNAGSATVAQQVRKDPAAGSTADLLYSQCAGTDIFRLQVGGASNAGWAEIATADDGSEPIYVRQYKGAFTSLQRTATLLDGSGNTSFPGQVTGVKFDGPLTWSGTAFSYNAGNSLYYYSGQPAIANCFEGSSNDFTKFSYPAGGTAVSSSNANIQTLRLDWGNTYWHDLFMSPNNNYLWHRNVVNSDARGWRRIVEENVTGLTDQSWNINIAGTAANVTGTVDIANGGTGATTRLNAVKALTNEAVSTPTYFLTITNGWAKAGYTTVAQAKTVLGITGDMGSHSDSEYVHKTGNETISGDKTFGNGTLIVDNGTGNNVHGEIKLNGTRPVYINADNSEDGLFANTACGMSIILNDSSKSIHIGGYSTNSSGRKFIKTTDKAPYLTLGTQEVGTQILVPENDTADSTFSITSTLKYASGASAKSFTVKFKQGDDGSSGVFPVANNKTDLGLSGNRWKNVYATNYYYGADAVEFSTKFVTTDTSQTIAGLKTFANNTMVVGRNTDGNSAIQLINSDAVGDSANGSSGFEVYGSSISDDNKIGGLTVGEYSNNGGAYATIEVNRTVSGVKTTTAIRSLIRSDGSKEFSPSTDNDIKLGHSSFRWSAIYGNTYYYGSNNVEFSTKFVTTDTDQSISGSKIFNGDKIVITQGNGYRMVCNADGGASGYGVFQRVDSVNWYLMVTAQNDALGSWTSARPASMNLSTGVLSINGNAATATQFSANKSVTLTGDVTGTASSKAGWSVATTLANSGVTAGTYGPSADVTGNNNATISVPEITVDAKGRVTSVTNRTLTCKNNTYNVYDKTLTIQKNGTNVATFTSNSNTDVTANITVPTKVSELTNDSGYLTSHQSLSNYVTLNTAQEITNTKTFKDANTVVKRTDIEAGNTLPSADKLARNIFQDKNGKELGSIYYYKNTSGNTGLCLRAGDWFSESEGVYSLNASGTNRRAELVLYTNSSGDCCIQPNGLFSTHIKPLNSSVYLGDSTKPFGRVYANDFKSCNAGLLPDTDVQTTEEHSIGFYGQNNTPLSYITFQKRPNLKDRVAIRINTTSSSYKSYDFDATCFYPESSNSVDIGSTTNIFKNIYCNNYYKGTTAFGDIVTHNASEFLTSHQSLANYVTLNGTQTISGIKTISTHLRFSSANTRGTAPSANEERDLIDYKDSAGNRISLFETMYYTDKSSKTSIYAYKTTAATGGNIGSIGIGCDASGNVYTYAPTPSSLDNSTKIATTAFVYNTAAKHLSAATNIYVAKVATGNGSGSNTSNYMALADLRTYLATVHMHSSTSNMNGSYNLQILFKAGDSFGDATFDATKMPGVRNLILNTSTGTNSTVDNYSTNSPTFGNINVTGDIVVTMRNLNCTGRISSQHGAYVSIDTYMGISSLMAANYGYLNVAKNMVINVCDAHIDYLFLAMNNGILAMWPGATVTINFRQQCYYTRSLFYASSNGTAWIGYSSFKLTGTEPMAVWGGSGTLTGTSETAAATVEKAVTLASGQTFTLTTNATAKVKFTVDNTANNPTLNIGGTGAKPIYWNNAPVQATMLMKNITYDVKYNGSQFVIQNAVKRLTNNDFGVFRSSGNYNQTYNSGSWNFTGWALYYGTGIENSNWRGSHIGNIQQNVSTANNTFPVLISGTANATANTLIAPYFAKGVKINPSTNVVSASGFDGPLTGDVTGNCSGTSANVTGTVDIANGGTGATTRLNAVKALTNEAVGTPTHFLAITTNYAKAGYTTVAQAKTVLGITGDIVSHNASEFLTSHQSLSSCVKNVVTNNQTIKSTGITRGTAPSSAQTFGIAFSDNNNKSIGNVYGQYATDKSTYIGLYAYKGTTTSNGDNASVRVGYDASGNAYTYAPTPATADNSTQIATTAFVKAQGYLTAHQSLANYVTTNTDQSISGIKSHSKHISILGDYVGNESSTNGRSCLYLKANRDTDGKSGLYITKFRQNVAQGSMGNSDVVFLSHDILENETRTNAGFVESYSNWTNNVPGGMSIYSSIATRNLGTSAKPWTNAYITNLNLNGAAFDPTSIDGVGTIKLLVYPAGTTEYVLNAGTTKAGSQLGEVWASHDSSSSSIRWQFSMLKKQSGTWKLLHNISLSAGYVDLKLIGLWVRIS